MSASTITMLFDSPLFRISSIACRHPRGGCGCECGGKRTHLTLLRRGGFGYHIDGTVVMTPSAARESMRSARLQRLGSNSIVRPAGAE